MNKPPDLQTLTAEDSAARLYRKLRPYLALAEYNPYAPRPQASLWIYTRCLAGSGFVPVYWSPRLRPGWRRLSFDEFPPALPSTLPSNKGSLIQ